LESSQSAKSVKKSASTGAVRPGSGLGRAQAQPEKSRGISYWDNLSFNGLPEALHSSARYNPLTAADEKIPLPVVHVKNKPQYLVFRCHSLHRFAKHGHLPVESSKQPSLARARRIFASKIVQTSPLPQSSSGPPVFQPCPSISQSLALPEAVYKAQNRCNLRGQLWELWTTAPNH
jgi:hypothetical protein